MTKEQRMKLDQLIIEYGNKEYARSHPDIREKALHRITDYLDLIQYNNALYNFQRFGVKDLEDLDLREWEKKGHLRK